MRTPDIVAAKLAGSGPFAVEQASTLSKQAAEHGHVQIREAREHAESNQTIKRDWWRPGRVEGRHPCKTVQFAT